MLDSVVPCSRLSFAVVFPVVTAPTWRASSTATRRPARASRAAVTSPVSPAPTTTSSYAAPGVNWSVSMVRLRSSQSDVMPYLRLGRARRLPWRPT